MPVWYKALNETEWHAGITQNISATGALIGAYSPVVPTQPIVVAIALPPAKSCLVSHGRIVRTVETPTSTAHSTFAITVKRYRIDRYDSVLRGIAH